MAYQIGAVALDLYPEFRHEYGEMPRIVRRASGKKPDRRFDGLRLNETLDAKFALSLAYDPARPSATGANERRLAALNEALNENLNRDDIFLGFFDNFTQRVLNLPPGNIWALNPLTITLAARDIVMDRRDGDCLPWDIAGDLMLEGIEEELRPRLKAVWGSLLWLHMLNHAQNFAFRLPQVLLSAGFDKAYGVSGEIDADGESLWATGRFGSGDEFAGTKIERRWRLSHADASGGLAAKALLRDMTRALLSEIIKLSLFGGGAWPGLMPLARAEDAGGPRGAAIVGVNDDLRSVIEGALGYDEWGGFEPDDVFAVTNWSAQRYVGDYAGLSAVYAPREWADADMLRGEALVVAARRFRLGVDHLPSVWIRRTDEGFSAGITAKIGFCELSGSARL